MEGPREPVPPSAPPPFEQIVAQHAGWVARSLVHLGWSSGDADDLAQEVFLKAYAALPTLRDAGAIRTWLYRIAVNTARNAHKARRRRREVPLETASGLPREIPGGEPSGLDLLEGRADRERVRRAIQALPWAFRVPLVLRELDGLSYEEIAHAMRCSPGTVDSRLHRARKLLKEKLSSSI